jgi:hypothetical protein
MKTKIYILFFLLISAFSIQANSQTAMLNPLNPVEQKLTPVKAFESRYVNGKVFLHITVNGNTETKIVAIERSLDATHFEVIGFIKVYGSPYPIDLAYYFTDESPVVSNLYYRLSYTSPSSYYDSYYSDTISVIPIEENRMLDGTLASKLNPVK